jgi:hypothetical protein
VCLLIKGPTSASSDEVVVNQVALSIKRQSSSLEVNEQKLQISLAESCCDVEDAFDLCSPKVLACIRAALHGFVIEINGIWIHPIRAFG